MEWRWWLSEKRLVIVGKSFSFPGVHKKSRTKTQRYHIQFSHAKQSVTHVNKTPCNRAKASVSLRSSGSSNHRLPGPLHIPNINFFHRLAVEAFHNYVSQDRKGGKVQRGEGADAFR